MIDVIYITNYLPENDLQFTKRGAKEGETSVKMGIYQKIKNGNLPH